MQGMHPLREDIDQVHLGLEVNGNLLLTMAYPSGRSTRLIRQQRRSARGRKTTNGALITVPFRYFKNFSRNEFYDGKKKMQPELFSLPNKQ